MIISHADKELAVQLDFEEYVLSILKQEAQTKLQKITIEKAIPESEREYFYLDEQSFCGQVIPQQKIPEYQGHVTKLIVEGVFVVLDLFKIREIITNLQASLLTQGYLLFATDYNYTENQGSIILIKSNNHYDALTIQLTNGVNYDISNLDIVLRLQQWKNVCSFQIIGAGFDWVELQFQTVPSDLNSFAQEIYEFCPDILDQGYVVKSLSKDADVEDWEEALEEQTIEDLAESLETTQNLLFWWD